MSPMDFIEFWTSRVDFLMPVLLSIFVLGVSLGIAGLTGDNLLRTVLILPAALILYGMGFAASPFGMELFWNLSAELLAALAALLIVFLYETLQSWAGALVAVAILALFLLVFVTPESPQANLFVNLSSGLIGAFLIVGLLRREWDFSPQNRDKMLTTAVREARKARDKAQAELGDYYLLVLGDDEPSIAQKIDFLKEASIDVFAQRPIEHDEETQLYYRLVNGKIVTVVKEPEAVLLANNEARLRLLAYPDTVKRVYKQVQEVLETSEVKQLEVSDSKMAHIEFKANTPKVLFSDYIEKQIMLLARTWRHGDQEHLILATDDLLAWAREMQFIRE